MFDYRREEAEADWADARAEYLESRSRARWLLNLWEYFICLGLLFAVVASCFSLRIGE